MKSIIGAIVAALLSLFGGHQFLGNPTTAQPASAVTAIEQPATTSSVSVAPTETSATATTTAASQSTTSQPIIEQVVQYEPLASSDFITQAELNSQLQQLSNTLVAKFNAPSSQPLPQNVAADGNPDVPYAAENNISNLSNVTISSPNFSGVTTSNISEGSNLYYTDARVGSYIDSSSTIPNATGTLGYVLSWNGSRWAATATSSLGIVGSGGGQWALSGLNIAYSSGNVGIGTTSPSALLSIDSTSTTGTILRLSNAASGGHVFDLISTGPSNTSGAGRFDIFDSTSGLARLSIAANGNVGIGTTSPFTSLSVNGNAFLSGNLNVGDATTTRSNLGLAYANTSDIINATNIATWGDSLTAGNEDGTGVTYPAVLAQLTGRTVYNGGVGGQTSTQIRARETIAPSYLLSSPTIIWAGRNNFSNASQVESDIAAMVAALGTNSNYLILSILNAEGEGTGTTNYNEIVAINSYLAATYPGHYLDVREYLVQDGLTAAGITPSSQDLTDISNDIPPTDLRYDSVHLNATGYTVVANYIYSNFSVLQAAPKPITTANLISFSLPSLGIGTSTPRGQLELYGGIATNTSLYLTNSGTNNSTQNLSLIFSQDEGDSVNAGQDGAGGKIVSGRDGLYGGSILTHNSNLEFYTALNGVDTEKMRITSTGNIGVGTSSPYARLDVAGQPTNNLNTLLQLSSVNGSYGTSTRMVLLSNGNLGLGTTTPNYQFSLVGAGSAGIQSTLNVAPTANANLSLTIADNTLNVTRTSDNTVQPLLLQTNGGNVGVGTTSPGSAFSIGNLTGWNFSVTGTTTESGAGGINLTSGCFALNGTCINSGGGTGTVGSGAAGQFPYYALSGTTLSATSTIFLATSGNIGIATTTPRGLLEIYGSARTNTSLYLTNSGTNNSTQTLSLVFSQDEGDSVNAGQDGAGGKIVSGRDGLYGGSILTHNSNLEFYTALNGVDTEKMRILSGGDVGIGTTSPAAALDIAGPATNNLNTLLQLSSVNGSYGTSTRMVLLSNGNLGLGTTTPNYRFSLVGAGSAGIQSTLNVAPTANANLSLTIADNTLNVTRTSDNTVQPLLLQTNGGNVGIGTTTPYSRFEVWGPDTASTTAFVVANNASTTEFSVYDTGNAVLAGSLTQNSDQRLKTNIQSLNASSSLSLINELNPVTFNWIDSNKGTTPQLGFIAQQVLPIFPNLVATTSPTALTPDGTLSLNYIDLISPIVSAIQALSQEISSIENRISGFADSFTTNQLTFNRATGQKLCLQKSDGTTVCVTGDQLAAVLASENQSPTNDPSTSGNTANASSTSNTPPVIQINGANPAIIQVGATYNDLGATITGPTADLNLDIQTKRPADTASINDIVGGTTSPKYEKIFVVPSGSP